MPGVAEPQLRRPAPNQGLSRQRLLPWLAPKSRSRFSGASTTRRKPHEFGAVAVAILLVKREVGYSVIERSRKGTGFDYWIGEESELPFARKARLEVSGIRKGTTREVNARVNEKLKQIERSGDSPPGYVIVVEVRNAPCRGAQEMSRVNDLHAQAMKHAEQAFLARLRGETELAIEIFRKALECEITAIDSLREYSETDVFDSASQRGNSGAGL